MRDARTPAQPAPNDRDSLVAALCSALESMLAEHRALRDVVARRREALRRAKIADLNACIASESEIAQRIATLDQRRENASHALLLHMGGVPAGSPRAWRPNSEWFASRLGGKQAERLRTIAAALRAAIEDVRAQNASTQQAAEHVARHIQGIVRSVEQRLSGSGAYTQRGVVSAPPAALCGVDITS